MTEDQFVQWLDLHIKFTGKLPVRVTLSEEVWRAFIDGLAPQSRYLDECGELAYQHPNGIVSVDRPKRKVELHPNKPTGLGDLVLAIASEAISEAKYRGRRDAASDGYERGRYDALALETQRQIRRLVEELNRR